ncbi:MAG: 1-acyl-sn-glycerol-3-phosphate acyltransferase [Anaerolineae bacterium]
MDGQQIQAMTHVEDLRRYITEEIVKTFGVSSRWARWLLGSIFRPAAERFSQLAASFDQYVASLGLNQAARWVLPVFSRDVRVHGTEHVPAEGPLLLTSNHPGTCDSLVIAANVLRPDLKIVATGVPFIRSLPSTAQYLIYCTLDPHERMNVVRSAIRHLRDGGALLIFPSGTLDPDPAISSGADRALETWSPSLEVILRKVPHAQVLVTIVSGVLASSWARNPLVRLRRTERDQRRTAEFLQVIQQMLFPRSLLVHPALSFAPPVTVAELSNNQTAPGVLVPLVERAKTFLASHIGMMYPARPF